LPVRQRSSFATLLVLLFVFAGGVGAAQSSDDSLNHAGLVIRHGDGRLTYAFVAFDEEEIGGIELLRRSGIEQVTIPFGGLGEGVCQIDGEGCSASECRRRLCQAPGQDSPYWRYFGLDESGVWVPYVLGPSSATVRDGDVQGWSWTPEEAMLPVITLAEVARLAGAPSAGEEADGRTVYTRTVYPPGVKPADEDEAVDPLAYAASAGLLLLVGGGTVFAVRRGRARREGGEEAA
jgi:hypothetical protein